MVIITVRDVQIASQMKNYMDGNSEIECYNIYGSAGISDEADKKAILATWFSGITAIEILHPLLKYSLVCQIHRLEVRDGAMVVYFEGRVEKQE
jgi:hypothetical protein